MNDFNVYNTNLYYFDNINNMQCYFETDYNYGIYNLFRVYYYIVTKVYENKYEIRFDYVRFYEI